MRPSFNLALKGMLTYLVFGIANLFGQTKAFLPPISFDAIFLAFCSIVFVWKIKKTDELIPLILLGLSLILLSLVERFLIKDPLSDSNEKKIGLFLTILSVFFLVVGTLIHSMAFLKKFLSIKEAYGRYWLGFIVLLYGFILSQVISMLTGQTSQILFYIYLACGLFAGIVVWQQQKSSDPEEGKYRFILLFFLSVFFDFINYISLLLLA
jgi:hypothetical protein